ncbi:MAG: phosphate ABC transporter permease subunit PstC [Deltaproteobacteria bacterium]|nr:phosphate ABC transporter permease subunit PstC [Deltaproteobacteria bacterium]
MPKIKSDKIFHSITALSGIFILTVLAGIFIILIISSFQSFSRFGFGFLFSADWNPVQGNFGAASSIFGTLVSTVIALLIALPLSIMIALFLVEYSPPILSTSVGFAIELLAAIPSIVYGMWGLFVLAPFLEKNIIPAFQNIKFLWFVFGGKVIGGQGVFTAGVILSVMIIPYITSVMRDVFKMVNPVLKESGFGMGATRWEVTRDITLVASLRGLVGATFLGLGRAVGETMAVTFVIGNGHNFTTEIFREGNTIASTLANDFGEAADQPLFYGVLMELALILFAITIIMQLASNWWIQRIAKKSGALN